MASARRVVAVAGASALLALGGAGGATGRDHGPDAGPESTWPRAAQANVTMPLARLIPAPNWRKVADAAKPEAPAAHPVEGAVDYGESDAMFGAQRSGHAHEGQDVFAPAGRPLLAVRDGVVLEAGSDAGRGNYVSVYSDDADETYVYFHMLSAAKVEVGERVRGGTEVGALGCTGSCYGDHLHFEVHRGEGAETPAVDPLPLLQRWE